MKATENRRPGTGSPIRWLTLVLVLGAAAGAANVFGAFNTVADGSKHPAYGALCVKQTEADAWGCMPGGGTLVAPNVLLSFAHGAPFLAGACKVGFTFDEIIGPSPVVYEVGQFIPDPAFLTLGLDDPHDLAVKTRIVRIGNSQGIRVPKPLLDHARLPEEVELSAEPGRLIVRAARAPRDGWADAARTMRVVRVPGRGGDSVGR